MIVLKILGGIDLASAIVFLTIAFGIGKLTPLLFFLGLLMFFKGLFVLTGDVLSIIDILSALALLLSIFFSLPVFIIWTLTFFLIAKGIVSFF